jgi:hypothetical protein
MNLLLSTRCGSTVGMGLLVSLLACGGEVILEPVPEQGGSARAELEQARALPDPVERQLAILAVLTESRAFPDPEVERICETELQSPALRERCERFLERTHLRLDPTRPGDPSGARAGGETEACGDHTGRARDLCLADRAFAEAAGPVAELETLLLAIADEQERGRTACGVLQAEGQPGSLARLEALTSLADATPSPWAAEAWSVLGAELPFRLDRRCRQRQDPGCEATLAAELLPVAVRSCRQAGHLNGQCFDHLCAAMAELAVAEHGRSPELVLAPALQSRVRQAAALDVRVEGQRGCGAIWAGRKLWQLLDDGDAAARGCAALDPEDRGRCLSALTEELLRTWLRAHPVSGEQELLEAVQGPDPRLAAFAPAAALPYLPCAGFSVLNFELEASLSGRRLPTEALLALRDAREDCAWARVSPP